MANTLVGVTNSTDNGSTTSRSVTRSVTAGRLCMVMCRWYGDQTVSSIACPGESPAMIGSIRGNGTNNNTARSQWASFVASGTGSRTVTLTVSGTVSDIKLSIIEISGQHASPIGASAFAFDVSTANPSTTLTTEAANSTILALLMSSAIGATPGTGYTTLGTPGWWSEEYGQYTTGMDAGAAGSKTVNWTSSAGNWHIDAIEILQAATSTQAPRSMSLYRNRRK